MMKTISVHDLHAALEKGAMLLDVRSPQEFAEEHIPGARNVPLQDLATVQDELKEADVVYVQCHSGGRSAQACMVMGAMGLTNLVNVEGGILDWKAAGFPVEQ